MNIDYNNSIFHITSEQSNSDIYESIESLWVDIMMNTGTNIPVRYEEETDRLFLYDNWILDFSQNL